jgi:hypothetical protein
VLTEAGKSCGSRAAFTRRSARTVARGSVARTRRAGHDVYSAGRLRIITSPRNPRPARTTCDTERIRSEGETVTHDPIAGSVLSITHFTNPSGCMSCAGNDCGDVATDSIAYTYTPFGQIASKTYSDGTTLQWGYDQLPAPQLLRRCGGAGSSCPASPTASDFCPSASTLLSWITYWPCQRRAEMSAVRRSNLSAVHRLKCPLFAEEAVTPAAGPPPRRPLPGPSSPAARPCASP